MSESRPRGIKHALKETWLFHVISVTILATAIASVEILRADKQNTNTVENTKNEIQSRSKIGEVHASTYNLEVKDIADIKIINPSFEENRPKELIAPESFDKTYDYYIDNLEFYFADENGKLYQIPTRGMAVKIGSPVLSVVYLSNSKPN